MPLQTATSVSPVSTRSGDVISTRFAPALIIAAVAMVAAVVEEVRPIRVMAFVKSFFQAVGQWDMVLAFVWFLFMFGFDLILRLCEPRFFKVV